MYRLDIEIEGLPKILTNARSSGWRAKHFEKKRWKILVMSQIDFSNKPKKPLSKAKIVMTRYSSAPSDFANRADSFKACLDALVESGVLIDDCDDVIIDQKYPWIKASPGRGRIRIEVESVA
jgi:hypothetical protein